MCGSTQRVIRHHLVARKHGGSDDPSNLLPLCIGHHTRFEADVKAGRDTVLRRFVEGHITGVSDVA